MRPRTFVLPLAVALFLGGCATSEPSPATDTRDLVPLAEVAAELGLSERPSGVPGEIRLVAPDGRGFDLVAGRATYRFQNAVRPVPAPGIVLDGRTFRIPAAMVPSMQRDLELPPGVVTLPPSTEAKRPRHAPHDIQGLAIVIDPGHGGKDPGAVGPGGILEKALVLDISRRVIAALEARGAVVTTTRKGDTFIELEDRAAVANRGPAALFVSLHLNAAENKKASGVEVFYPEDGARGRESASAARAVARAMASNAGAENRGAKLDQRGLRVLKATRMPAILVEMGFLSNAGEAQRLRDPAYQQRIADGIADGIEAWLDI